jgi:hypothetical protein
VLSCPLGGGVSPGTLVGGKTVDECDVEDAVLLYEDVDEGT